MSVYNISNNAIISYQGLPYINPNLMGRYVGVVGSKVYVFYSEWNDWLGEENNRPTPFVYKYSDDNYTAKHYIEVIYNSVTYRVCNTGIGIIQGSNCVYLIGVIKVGVSYKQVYVKFTSLGMTYSFNDTEVVTCSGHGSNFEISEDILFIGETLPWPSDEDIGYVFDWNSKTIIKSCDRPFSVLPRLHQSNMFLNYFEDVRNIYLGFCGMANDDTNISLLRYYFLCFDKIALEFYYKPFNLDFEPDVPSNNYTRKRIVAMCKDYQERIIIGLSTYSYKNIKNKSPLNEFPDDVDMQYEELVSRCDWCIAYSDKNVFSRLQQYQGLEWIDHHDGLTFDYNLQKDITNAVVVTSCNKSSPLVPYADKINNNPVTNWPGMIHILANREGFFEKDSFQLPGQYVCCNQKSLPCISALLIWTFKGWTYSPGTTGNIPLYNLTLETLNLAGYPPSPEFLTSKSFWYRWGFLLYVGFSDYYEITAKQIQIYDGATKIVDRTINDNKKWIEILESDNLEWNKEYKYIVRIKDVCGYWSSWTDYSLFWIREKPLVTVTDCETKQFPKISFKVNPYNSLIVSFDIEVWDGVNLKYSKTIDKPYEYFKYEDNEFSYFEYVIDPENLSDTLENKEYTFKVKVKNDYNRVGEGSIVKTLSFTIPDDVTNLQVYEKEGYYQLNWEGGYSSIYRNGVRIGFGNNVFNDYSCPMNTDLTYVICARGDDAQSLGVSKDKKLTKACFALVSDVFNSYFGMVEGHVTIGSNATFERQGDNIYFDYEQKSGNFPAVLSIEKTNQLLDNYFEKQFHIKFGTEVIPIAITQINSITDRALGQKVLNITYEKVILESIQTD